MGIARQVSFEGPPALVYNWRDTKTTAVGWVVMHSVANKVSGGGIFMHANATQQEVADIARNMALKVCLCHPLRRVCVCAGE